MVLDRSGREDVRLHHSRCAKRFRFRSTRVRRQHSPLSLLCITMILSVRRKILKLLRSPTYALLRKGLIWIHMFHATVRFTLILLLYLRMLAIEVNHKWDACPSKGSTQAPVHPHTKLFMVLSVKCLLNTMLSIELHLLITLSLVVK